MKCEIAYEELAALSAGELPQERSQELERHANQCPVCGHRLAALHLTDVALADLRRRYPSAGAVLAARRATAKELAADGPEVMTLQEVADLLRLPAEDVDEIAADLPAFEVAGRLRVRRSRLIQWIEKQEKSYTRRGVESDVAAILAGLT